MSLDLEQLAAGLTRFWADWGALVIAGTGLLALALVTWALVRFARSHNRSKIVSAVAAVVVMAWTSEGLLAVAIRKVGLPWPFALLVFAVFELMMIAAAMRAEESRRTRGVTGPAGPYVFVIAFASGVISAFGARSVGEIVLRIILPPLAVGLWWILLTSERDTDSAEIKAKREEARAASEATWVITPTTVLVRLGIKRPGRSTTSQAQREHLRDRMVALADRAETLTGRRRARLVRRLRVLTRGADEAMVIEVAERVARARRAEELMITDPPVRIEAPALRTESPGARAHETAHDGARGAHQVAGTHAQHDAQARAVRTRRAESPSARAERSKAQTREDEARAAWLASHEAGVPLSGRALGRQFERSERWGVAVAAAARKDLALRSNGHGPVVEVDTDG